MPASLKRFPEYKIELGVLSGAVTHPEILELYSAHDKTTNWVVVFAESVDLSGVDVACLPVLKRALASEASESPDAGPKRTALINLSESNEIFVRFWAHYASQGVHRERRLCPTYEAACRWLGLPAAAAERLAAATATAAAGAEAGSTQAAQTRRKLVKAASRIFRERGYEAMTLDEVVAAAGLPSRDLDGLALSKNDLVVHALLDAMGDLAPIQGDMADYAAGYLSPAQKADVAGGCAMAALASDTLRQSPEARAAMTTGLAWNIDRLSRIAPGRDEAARHRAAVRAWAAMIGAMILARVSDDEALSREFLDETQSWLADPAVAAAGTAGSAPPEVGPLA